MHGGAARTSPPSRYRQWMTHKLSTWWDQFDTSGCVGCGRCITWCPVGIDITEEAAAIRATDGDDRGRAVTVTILSVEQLAEQVPLLAGLEPPHPRPRRGLRLDRTVRGRRPPRARRVRRRTRSSPCARVASRSSSPRTSAHHGDRDARPGRRLRLVVAVRALPVAVRRPRDRARSAPCPSTARACAARSSADDPLGYALMRRFVPVLLDRLQATRLRLVDVYGNPAG